MNCLDALLFMFLLSIENQNFTNIIVSKVQRFADKHRLAWLGSVYGML